MPTVYRFTALDENMSRGLSPHYGTPSAIATVAGAERQDDSYIVVSDNQLAGHGFYPKANEWGVKVVDRVVARLGNNPNVRLDEGYYFMVLEPDGSYVLSQAETGPRYELTRAEVENYFQGKLTLDAGIWPPKTRK
jgi:hypothetical protein